ncbi:MAG: aminotransferase class I/II-fold pyridoxal phosphate-dependent enzyme [Chitinophagaceae bacterium]
MPFHPLVNERTKRFLENKIPGIHKSLTGKIRLQANENGIGSPTLKWYNRFTNDDDVMHLKSAIAAIKKTSLQNLYISAGQFSFFDTFVRCFCEAEDNIIFCSPVPIELLEVATFNGINFQTIPLTANQQLDMIHLENVVSKKTKIIWIASPNHYTGNNMLHDDIETILNNFPALLVLDECFINFSKHRSFLPGLNEYPNLVICQDFNYAWGLAGLEIEMAFASQEIISVLEAMPFGNRIQKPAIEIVQAALPKVDEMNTNIKAIVAMRNALVKELQHLPYIENIFPSDANFLLIKFRDAEKVNTILKQHHIAVYDLSKEKFYENCLRVSIGSEKEINAFIEALAGYE